jgi:hypothetical protein
VRLRSDTRAHEPDSLADAPVDALADARTCAFADDRADGRADDRADDRRAAVGCVLPWVPRARLGYYY